MPKLRAGRVAQSMAASLRPNSFFASARGSVRSNCSRQSRLPSYFSLGKTTTIVGERPNTWRKRDEARTRTFVSVLCCAGGANLALGGRKPDVVITPRGPHSSLGEDK